MKKQRNNATARHATPLTLTLFGNPVIARDEIPITRFRSDKARALLMLLALEQDKPHTRDYLCEMFWGGMAARDARHNLSQALFYLQQALGKDTVARVLDVSHATLQFRVDADAYVDAREFLELLRACETHPHRRIEACAACMARLERAVSLYRGELLAHFFLDNAPPFEEWLLVQREHLQRLVTTALSQMTSYYEAQGAAAYAQAEKYARRQIELEAWHEEPYRVLMRLYAAQNQTEQALAAYHALASVLHRELNLEPSAETNALYKHLRSKSTVVIQHSTVNRQQSPISSLPLPSTPLVGREIELAQLAERISRADCRLLTLVGQGGIGKTRLALETARNNLTSFPCGAYFVDLTAAVSMELMPHAVAEALRLPLRGSSSAAQQLTAHLQNIQAPMLLILDNLEQLLVDANTDTRVVSEMLQRAPNVTLLVTSRERLNLAGEWLYPVEGLRAPTTLPARVESEWDSSEAVQLLAQCALRQRVDTDAWSADEKRAAIRITQLVEGMPLAIELASAWLRTLAPSEIANEIARSLDVLTSTRRDLPARHASIRAVFEHSWKLLTPTEQHAFARLSVLRGGFTREAAREIADAVLQTLSALLEKSLVRRTATGRYTMHPLVAQFAAEKNGADDALAQRHCFYFLEWVSERAQALTNEGARRALDEFRVELENMRAAWSYAVAHNAAELGAYATPAIGSLFRSNGQFQAALDLFVVEVPDVVWRAAIEIERAETWLRVGDIERAVQAAELARVSSESLHAELRARAELAYGMARARQGEYDIAESALERAHALARASAQPDFVARAKLGMGLLWHLRGDNRAAIRHFIAALETSQAAGNLALEAQALSDLATMHTNLGEHQAALPFFERALSLRERQGDLWGMIRTEISRGGAYIFQAQFEAAIECLERAARWCQEIGDRSGYCIALVNLSEVWLELGASARALELASQANSLASELNLHWAIVGSWANMAYAHLLRGELAQVTPLANELLASGKASDDSKEQASAFLLMAQAASAQADWRAAQAWGERVTQALQGTRDADLEWQLAAELAFAAAKQNDFAAAREHVEWVMTHLDAQVLRGWPDRTRTLWFAIQVLQMLDDARHASLLKRAYETLEKIAAQIQSTELRTSYLENVSWHREIQRAYKSLST